MNKELTKNLAPGHSSCAGCALPVVIRTILAEAPGPVVIVNATSCSEVTTTLYPYTAWKVPYIHNAFENAGATVSGVEKAYEALKKKGRIKEKINFVVFAGDGGTYDIGLQALSGALERGHNFLYVVYDNGAYMNTGNQRSSATPYGANTETAPAGKNSFGKAQRKKDLLAIVAAHHVPYAAQANVAFLADLKKKARKAFAAEGPKFLDVFSPCTNNWKFPPSEYVNIARLATETNFWPLYEIENGKYVINYIPKTKKPIEEFLKTQGRFKHLFAPENKKTLEKMQQLVDEEWKKLVSASK
jgi:pyruvate ferredoxin oxidoreductase beta subunit